MKALAADVTASYNLTPGGNSQAVDTNCISSGKITAQCVITLANGNNTSESITISADGKHYVGK